jgi:hypothetical protein
VNEAGAIVKDHWPWLLGGFGVIVLVALLSVVGLILFTRWVVHIEFGRLTSTLHADISDINAKLSLIAKAEWSDLALNRKFADIDTVLRMTSDKLDEVLDTQRAHEDEQNAIRVANKDYGERLQVVEAWKGKISDMSIIRGGF